MKVPGKEVKCCLRAKDNSLTGDDQTAKILDDESILQSTRGKLNDLVAQNDTEVLAGNHEVCEARKQIVWVAQ